VSISLIIIILTGITSFIVFKQQQFFYKYAFIPSLVKKNHEYYRLISYAFLHADLPHLLFNMFSFFMFGELLEKQLILTYGNLIGELHFIILYLVGALVATLWPYIRNVDNANYISVGASGAVSSIVFASMLWNPTLEVGIIFLPFYIPAYIFAPLYLAFEYWSLKKGKSNIAHDAHIGGAIFGLIYLGIINVDKIKQFTHIIF
jgi:membrane associated rhomboid family serine protease